MGANAKMNEFEAIMGLCNLKQMSMVTVERKKIAERYRKRLQHLEGIKLPQVQEDVTPNYAYFPVIFTEKSHKNRDEIYEILKENNIYSRKYFYPLTNALDCYKEHFHMNETPVAMEIASRVLTLPLHANLKLEDVDLICDIIKECT